MLVNNLGINIEMQEGFHTLVIGETFPWTLTPALTEDNVGPGSDDSVIYT